MLSRLLLTGSFTALAAVLSGCGGGGQTSLIDTAQAQTTKNQIEPIDVATINAVIAANPVVLQGGTIGKLQDRASVQSDRVTPQVFASTGWNYNYPSYCMSTMVGGYVYTYLYFVDGVFIYTADPTFTNFLSAACVGARVVGVYVTTNYVSYATWSHVVILR